MIPISKRGKKAEFLWQSDFSPFPACPSSPHTPPGFPDTPCHRPVFYGARLGSAVLVQLYSEDTSGHGHVEPLLFLCLCFHLPVDLSIVSLHDKSHMNRTVIGLFVPNNVCYTKHCGILSLTPALYQTATRDQPNGFQRGGGCQPVLPGGYGFLPAPDWRGTGPQGFPVSLWDRGLARQPLLSAAGLPAVNPPGHVTLRAVDWDGQEGTERPRGGLKHGEKSGLERGNVVGREIRSPCTPPPWVVMEGKHRMCH